MITSWLCTTARSTTPRMVEAFVSEMKLDELQELDAGYREDGDFAVREGGLRVPTLREVLTAFRSSRLNLEMKEFTSEEALSLCRLLQEFDAEARVLVASFGHEPMLAFRRKCPSVATSATLRETYVFYYLHRLRLGSLYRSPAVAFSGAGRPPRDRARFSRARASRQYPSPGMDDQRVLRYENACLTWAFRES